MRRAARDIVRAIGTGPGGMLRTWDGLTYSVVREIWLCLARRFNEIGMGGPAWTERVTQQPGRGWYGIRREATDIYEDYETDERVLNDQTGHRSSDTRGEVYQEKEREVIWAKSAQTRRRVRAAAFGRQRKESGP